MRTYQSICLIGLILLAIYSCETHDNSGGTDTTTDPPTYTGYFTINDTLGAYDSVVIQTVELVDSSGSYRHFMLDYSTFNFTTNIVVNINGTGTYPFHQGTGPIAIGEASMIRYPNCGTEFYSGGTVYFPLSYADSVTYFTITQFDTSGISGSYNSDCGRYNKDYNCTTHAMLDSTTIWGNFSVDF